MLLNPLAFPRVIYGKITGKAFKESMSIEWTGKGRKEVLKLCLIPWQTVQESNPDIGFLVTLEVDGGLALGVLIMQK